MVESEFADESELRNKESISSTMNSISSRFEFRLSSLSLATYIFESFCLGGVEYIFARNYDIFSVRLVIPAKLHSNKKQSEISDDSYAIKQGSTHFVFYIYFSRYSVIKV